MPLDPTPSLAQSRSPFLRHGATQPVSWLPWGDEAFDRAKREVRPILLDIGAVWCHWCHVMDRESYENEDIARTINDNFVPVKVDRDERPDVDARYQRAVQTLSGEGGWPLTAFLTPEGEVFYGGTYFPPADGMGRPSLPRVLNEVLRVWTEQRERALEMARQVRERVSAYEQAESQVGELSPAMVTEALEDFAHAFDFRNGGFGRSPKFPNAGALLLLLDRHLDLLPEREPWAMRIVAETLAGMARGGIHDQLGGGFHRYATDARWLVPHFEKMAYDNGPLLEAYARAAAVTGDEALRRVAEGIVAYYGDVAPQLLAAGGFPASQDADIAGEDDGDYWTWTEEEIRSALPDERAARAAIMRFGLDEPAAAMPHEPERHVLYAARALEDVAQALGDDLAATQALLADAARRLKQARDARPRPFVDETVYSGWSSLVACGFLAAARYLGLRPAGEAALRALDRIWDEGFDVEDGVVHRPGDREGGYLEDQAAFALALLDAYEYAQDEQYLERARAVAVVMLARFRDAEGAFQDRPAGESAPARPLAQPHRPIADAPAPAGNALAALVLLRLAALLQDTSYADQAVVVLSVFAGSAPRMATSCATYFRAVDWATSPVTTCVVVGVRGDESAQALLDAARKTYRPRTVVRFFEAGAVRQDELPVEMRAMLTARTAASAYLCVGNRCLAPITAAAELRAALTG
ncbi:MAG TPA: thioredoxin domain-containing protein [Longimicrobiales bacterium]